MSDKDLEAIAQSLPMGLRELCLRLFECTITGAGVRALACRLPVCLEKLQFLLYDRTQLPGFEVFDTGDMEAQANNDRGWCRSDGRPG